jgi:hypothetical protein
VEIRSTGTCCWCGKQKSDVVQMAFSDQSFQGAMCFGDFKKALTMKCGGKSVVPTPAPAIGGRSVT